MIYGLGPRARRVYSILRDRITRGDLAPGSRLPSHRELAVEFGVAPLTVRQVLGELEEHGLVSRQVGRGTFVRAASGPDILLIQPDARLAGFLADHVGRAGYRSVTVSGLTEATAALSHDPDLMLALVDVHLPSPGEGARIVRSIRSRWPRLPIAAIATDLSDLAGLFGTPEWPLHILPSPIDLDQLVELVRLVGHRPVLPD